MKNNLITKLLGIVVLGLLLNGCVPTGGLSPNELRFTKNGKEIMKKTKKYPYGAYWTLQKKGFNRQGFEYGFTRSEAKKNAWDVCEIKRKKIGKGECKVYQACNSRGSECDLQIAYKKRKAAKKSSSGSKIDPSVWDDILGASQGILSGKSVSESLGGTSSSSSSSSSSMSCFKKSESTTGTNKICIYNCMGSDVAINVKSTRLCPMSIKK
jgi:hypothetical protein